MAEEGRNIRSIIKNATEGGLTNRLKGENDTIATKEEIDIQKNKVETPKVKMGPKLLGLSGGLNLKKAESNPKREVLSQGKVSSPSQDISHGVSISQKAPISSPFENNINTPINNIKVEQENNETISTGGDMMSSKNKADDIFINGMGRAKELKAPVDVDNAIMDLYLDVKGKIKNGTLASSDLIKMKQVYPEFAGLKDDVLLAMIGDMGSMANNNIAMDNDNLQKFKSLYPELTSVSWGLAIPSQQNMYQAGGMKEAMTSASSIDLNNYGTAGAIAEGVINPVGEVFTLIDAAAQNIPQVDSNKEFTGTPALKRKLESLTQEDIDNYYKRYQNAIKEHPKLMKGYTTILPGDTVVEQLWNWVRGKGVQDADAGFRSWMIDQVNNEVNGWKGEFLGSANELQGAGPNVAKMFMNMPASGVKTVTAIARAITNPADTTQGLVILIKDAYENAKNGTFSDSLIGQRYGSWDAFSKAMEQDPVGVASDLLAVAELGTSAVGTVSKTARWGARGASMATRAVGVEKTSSNLMRIADRLKNVEGRLGEFSKSVGGASDLGIRQLFYGLDGKGGLIGGLEKWAGEGDKFYNKAAKYMVKAQQPGKTTLDELKKVKDAGGPIGRIAEGITGVGDAEGKLLKAANPNTNLLRNSVDYKNKKANMDTATKAIVDAGYTPKTIEEWAKAHIETLNSKWKEFKDLIKDKGSVTIDAKDLLRDVKSWLATEKEGATVNQRGDIVALEKEIADLERRGNLSMEFLENRKEHYNSSYKDADKMKKGDIYEKGIKNIGNAIRKAQDNILGNGPESTKKLRNEIKALIDTKEDVQKANLRRQKQKEGGGLIENYGRISGLGDILEGTFKTVTGRIKEGVPQATKGVGKVILGKALGRAKDVDFLTETGFRGLKKKVEGQKGVKTTIENKGKEGKEVKMTGNGEKNEYINKDNLNPNQNKDGLIKKSKNDTGKSQENLQGLGKKEKNTNQGGVGGKTSQKAWNDGGRVSQGDGGYLELKTSGKDIVKTLEKIKGEQPEGFKMDIHGADKYGNGKRKTFQSNDGNSSVTVKDDGDITSLVSKKGLGRGKELVLTAIKNGGEKLDCYEDKLPDLYQRGGFEPVARVKWNAEYAPKDWEGKGQDIIVMMRRNNDSVDKVAENWGKYEKIDLDDLPVMDYDTALEFRDMLLEERKLAEKNGGTKTKPIWEEEINPKTGEKYTKDEVKKEMEKIRDKYLNDENKLRKLYDNYKKINSEFNADKDPIIEERFDRNGYINPDGLRPLINKEFAEEIGVGDNVLASTNHPAVSKIADAFVEMISNDMVAKAKKGDKVMVALIGGGGGSGKSGGPKAMVSEGFVKEGERVDMTLDVQGGGDDLEKLIDKAKKEGVLDKFSFKIAYVYASTRDAGGGAIKRTISQNKRILEKMGINPETVAKDTDIGKNRLYAGRSLPLDIFEGGHIKSASEEKGLRKYIALAQEIDNLDLMITERIDGDRNNTTKHIVKKDGEWKISDDDLKYLVDKIVKNKEEGLSKIKDDLEKDGREAVEKGEISKRQFQDFFGKAFSLAFIIMLLGGNDEDEEVALV